jgi:hypothetical protein
VPIWSADAYRQRSRIKQGVADDACARACDAPAGAPGNEAQAGRPASSPRRRRAPRPRPAACSRVGPGARAPPRARGEGRAESRHVTPRRGPIVRTHARWQLACRHHVSARAPPRGGVACRAMCSACARPSWHASPSPLPMSAAWARTWRPCACVRPCRARQQQEGARDRVKLSSAARGEASGREERGERRSILHLLRVCSLAWRGVRPLSATQCMVKRDGTCLA